MSIKKHIFCIFQPSLALPFITLLLSGCATIDRIISPSPPPTESPSPLTTESPSSDPGIQNDNKPLDDLVRTRECFPPNKTEYVFGNYKLGWTMGGNSYEGLLHMEGRIGKMRIQFFSDATSRTETVDQTMVLASCTKGLVVLGFNPVIAGTNQKHPTYNADNLIFRRETSGDVTIMNYDDSGQTAPVNIEQISN